MECENYNLLLMTWTIKPNTWILNQWYSKTIDSNERLKQYISTILYYLTIENINWIVFIDNSNYNIDNKLIENIKRIAISLWKDIEFLNFQWNTENQLKYTYWYWEFETLKFMYLNSILFNKTDSIYKVTWRYKIYNIWDLIKKSINLKNLFYKYNIFNFSWLNMVFFKISKSNIQKTIDNYDKVFLNNINSKIKLWWEEILFNILSKEKLDSLRIYPYFYTLGNLKYLFYNSLTIIGFFDLNSILYRFFLRISLVIPEFIKVNFNKLLKNILKWLKRS